MAKDFENRSRQHEGRWRLLIWGTAALLLLLPAAAMQITDEVAWDHTDFVVFGAMLLAVCGAYELASRSTHSSAYRGAVGVALAAAFVLVWVNLAVGLIGTENNPANLMYAGVLLIGIMGGVAVRFRARQMSYVMIATAIAQVSVAIIALAAGLGNTLLLTAVFTALWLTSGWLFRHASIGQEHAGA